jgi:hypothetical protein
LDACSFCADALRARGWFILTILKERPTQSADADQTVAA